MFDSRKLSALIFLCLLPFGPPARGDLELIFDSATYSAMSGDMVDVRLLLSDPDGVELTPLLGIIDAGGRIVQTAGTATLSITAADITTPFTFLTLTSPDPDPFLTADPGNVAGFGGSIPFLGAPVGDGMPTVELARFMFTVTGAPGSTATIMAAEYDEAAPAIDLVAEDGFLGVDLDPFLTGFGSATITVAVPEPAACTLSALAALALTTLRRRRYCTPR